jgi:hypothetical protein
MQLNTSMSNQLVSEFFSPTNLFETNGSAGSYSGGFSWSDGQGGSGGWNNGNSGCVVQQTWSNTDWPVLADGTQVLIGSCNPALDNDAGYPDIIWEHCDLNAPTNSNYGPVWGYYDNEIGGIPTLNTGWISYTYVRQAQTTVLLDTGSQGVPGAQSLFLLHCTATDELTDTPVLPWDISIGNYGNWDIDGDLWLVLDDGQTVDVTPRVSGDSYYLFNYDNPPEQFILFHNTQCTAWQNQDKYRKTIGIGEVVNLGGMTGDTYWTLSGAGSLDSDHGGYVTFTASMSPGAVVVTAEVEPGKALTVPFDVKAPTGVAASLASDVGFGNLGSNSIGAYSIFNMYLLPLTVSFDNVIIREVMDSPISIPWPCSNNTMIVEFTNYWAPPGCGNFRQDDIQDGPLSINYLLDGTNYVSIFSYTFGWEEQYLNQDSNWITFANMQTTTTYNSNKQCQETYQGVPGGWQGPWATAPP